eukprot:GEMP01010065.1.p1 GENE.GEMP01010065.1~~GEMP01010065.1.p1  ORF type:complete len:599 (+),score=95.25 GEMP01010065.1:149-1945(+)
MLIYTSPRGVNVLRLLFICHGSAIPLASRVAIFPACFSILLRYIKLNHETLFGALLDVHDPFALQIFAGLLGFALVFRMNNSLQRYWEGVTHMEVMTSKWADCYNQLCNYIHVTRIRPDGDPAKEKRLDLMRTALIHWFSMMGAEAICNLRNEDPDRESRMPKIVARPYAITKESRRTVRRKTKRRTTAICRSQPDLMRDVDGRYSVTNAFKSYKAPNDDTELRLNRSWLKWIRQSLKSSDVRRKLCEWFGGLSNRKRNNVAPDEDFEDDSDLVTLEIIGCILKEEAEMLEGVNDKVCIIAGWITMLVTEFANRDWLACPNPVLSRVYQEMSHGLLAYRMAFTIAMIPFPFCFAQVLQLLLFVFIAICPFMISVLATGYIMTFVLTFCVSVAYWGVNEISRELENPYGVETNDLPLEEMHADFIDTIHSLLPRGTTDEDPFSKHIEKLFCSGIDLRATTSTDDGACGTSSMEGRADRFWTNGRVTTDSRGTASIDSCASIGSDSGRITVGDSAYVTTSTNCCAPKVSASGGIAVEKGTSATVFQKSCTDIGSDSSRITVGDGAHVTASTNLRLHQWTVSADMGSDNADFPVDDDITIE